MKKYFLQICSIYLVLFSSCSTEEENIYSPLLTINKQILSAILFEANKTDVQIMDKIEFNSVLDGYCPKVDSSTPNLLCDLKDNCQKPISKDFIDFKKTVSQSFSDKDALNRLYISPVTFNPNRNKAVQYWEYMDDINKTNIGFHTVYHKGNKGWEFSYYWITMYRVNKIERDIQDGLAKLNEVNIPSSEFEYRNKQIFESISLLFKKQEIDKFNSISLVQNVTVDDKKNIQSTDKTKKLNKDEMMIFESLKDSILAFSNDTTNSYSALSKMKDLIPSYSKVTINPDKEQDLTISFSKIYYFNKRKLDRGLIVNFSNSKDLNKSYALVQIDSVEVIELN